MKNKFQQMKGSSSENELIRQRCVIFGYFFRLSLMPVKFNLSDFVEKYDLGDPDFGNFIYSED